MLSNPKPGTRVRLHYAGRWFRHPRFRALYQGAHGTVLARATGRKPKNHLVRLDDGTLVSVPGGQLWKETDA
jgi:hypothetical protein